MTWNKFTGTIKGDRAHAEVELLPDNEGWECKFEGRFSYQVCEFEEGGLEQAYEWCKSKVRENDEGTSIQRGNS
tara:strand:+ start:541 stop:762 length:222 start_codon:yes stop_codon:yes gene_type:complete